MTPSTSLRVGGWRTEAVAGVTTFFTMAYIVVVNPSILSAEGTGMPFSGVLTATVLVCFTMSLLMGLYADLPFAVAPGMGINAFFTYSVILGQGVPWPQALGIVFWAGVLFLVVSVTPVRELIARSIPSNLRSAAAVGIGIFLTFIGLKNAGIVAADPVTFVKPGRLGREALLALIGGAVMVRGMQKKSPFAFLSGIAVATLLAWGAGMVKAPETWISSPDFSSVFMKLDIVGALKLALLPAMIGILFTDLFDSISTFVGVSHAAGMIDKDGNPRRLREGLIVDAFATLGAGLAGTSSGTAYIESAAGIEVGGRTGLTAVFAALCFLPCFFLAPVAGMVPAYATAPVLILVGALMFRSVAHLRLHQLEEAVPAFLTIIMIPLTFSITQGILWGFISYVGLHLMTGRHRDIPRMLYALAAASVFLLVLEHGAWAAGISERAMELNRTGRWSEARELAVRELAKTGLPDRERCEALVLSAYSNTRLGEAEEAGRLLELLDKSCAGALQDGWVAQEAERLKSELRGAPPRPAPKADDGFWKSAAPESLGLNPDAMKRYEKMCQASGADSCLVAYRGRIVSEWYRGGYSGPVPAMSATKSVTALLAGMLRDEGKITSFDEPVSRYLSAWNEGRRARVTLRHLLSHTAGFRRREKDSVGFESDKNAFVEALEPDSEPGTKWTYSNEGVQLLSPILDRAAGVSIHVYAEQRLFRPLGMNRTRLRRDSKGHAWTYADMETTPRDIARIGQLILQRGKWEGKQVISEEFLEEALRPSQDLNRAVGLLWWLFGDPSKPEAVAALGYLDTNLYVFPKTGLIVVRTQARPVDGASAYDPFPIVREMVRKP